jgi:hypothetical protein
MFLHRWRREEGTWKQAHQQVHALGEDDHELSCSPVANCECLELYVWYHLPVSDYFVQAQKCDAHKMSALVHFQPFLLQLSKTITPPPCISFWILRSCPQQYHKHWQAYPQQPLACLSELPSNQLLYWDLGIDEIFAATKRIRGLLFSN